MLLLPLLLGVCLDATTLPLFGCTGEARARFMAHHLVGSLLLHWVRRESRVQHGSDGRDGRPKKLLMPLLFLDSLALLSYLSSTRFYVCL